MNIAHNLLVATDYHVVTMICAFGMLVDILCTQKLSSTGCPGNKREYQIPWKPQIAGISVIKIPQTYKWR